MRRVAGIRAVLLGLLLVFAVFAQRDLGTIAGTVTDPTGAAIPNAKITITEVATNESYTLTSNSSGEYVRPALKPGTYTVAAEAQGFRRVAQENVLVTAGDRIGVPLTLPVGNLSESIEVSANAPLLQTENTSQGADLNAAEVNQLPMGGQRVFAYLARLSPGVLVAEPGARDAQNGGAQGGRHRVCDDRRPENLATGSGTGADVARAHVIRRTRRGPAFVPCLHHDVDGLGAGRRRSGK